MSQADPSERARLATALAEQAVPEREGRSCSASSFVAATTSIRLDSSARRRASRGTRPPVANKFVQGVCELPKVKCGDCTNQAFRPVDDGAVLGHLRGKHVMGVYPMLPDETCWFLAVDFDKGTWKEDVRAFAETARRLGLPALIERSRSGKHAAYSTMRAWPPCVNASQGSTRMLAASLFAATPVRWITQPPPMWMA